MAKSSDKKRKAAGAVELSEDELGTAVGGSFEGNFQVVQGTLRPGGIRRRD